MSDSERTKKDIGTLEPFNTLQYKDFFGSNVLLNFVCKKADRLSAGVFLVTETFQKDDPLRSSLRSRSLDLLHALYILSEESLRSSVAAIGEIVALLSIATVTGSISPENKSMLESEYQKLASLIVERSIELTQRELPEKSFFELSELEQTLHPRASFLKGHTYKKGQSFNDMGRGSYASLKEATSFMGGIYAGSPRQEKILSIIDDKVSVSIRDVALSIKDCSEKTLQRDLLSLVERGVLKKEGERRWSTYRRV